jgi:RHS repeat-associated protein
MPTKSKPKSYHSPILGIFTCDQNGNLTSDGTWTHAWDYQNRLSSSTDSTSTITYTYDHSGQRASLANNTTTTYYPSKNYNINSDNKETKHIMAGGALVATVQHSVSNTGTGTDPSCTPPPSGDWTVTTSCTFTGTAIAPASVIVNPGELLTLTPTSKLLIDLENHKLLVKHTGGVLIKQGATLRQVKAEDTSTEPVAMYIHTDHLGGTNVTTDESGAVSELVDYYPYGNQRISSGTNTSQRQYIGEHYDPETNLNYLNARYYKSPNGQFISQDPVFLAVGNSEQIKRLTKIEQNEVLKDPQMFNSYSYGRGNPIRYSDPDGKFIPQAVALGALYGGVANVAFQAYSDHQNNSSFNLGTYSYAFFSGVVTGAGAVFNPFVGAGLASSFSLGESVAKNGGQVTVEGGVQAITEGAVTGLTAGFLKGIPQVRGVQATKVLGGNYFSGAHGMRYAGEAALGLGLDVYSFDVQGIANSLIENISSITDTTQSQTSQNQSTAPTITSKKGKN